jgi:hypothetical protein
MLPYGNLRQALFGVTFAIFVSLGSVLALCFGVAGSSGNSVFTGAVLTIVTVALGLLCFRRGIVLLPVDYLFFAFSLCVVSSFVFNGWTSNVKEYVLLVLSLAAYPACRFVSRADIVSGRYPFVWTTSIIVLLGSIATAAALWQHQVDHLGKTFVFGFGAAATDFLGSLCFLIIALVTTGRLTMRRTALISSLIFLPTAIFAASMVRFTFIALAGALFFATVLSEAKQRKQVIAVGLVILLAVAVGLLVRYNQAMGLAELAIEQFSIESQPIEQLPGAQPKIELPPIKQTPAEQALIEQPHSAVRLEKPPSCHLKVNLQNTIAIRKALAQDAVFLLPGSGWIGTGLDSFMDKSCIKLTEVHNSILQAAVEFGWLGGSLLFLIFVVTGGSLLSVARQDDASRFVFCSLAFVLFLSLAHGRVSREAVSFALLGCAVGVRDTSRAAAPAVSAAVA